MEKQAIRIKEQELLVYLEEPTVFILSTTSTAVFKASSNVLAATNKRFMVLVNLAGPFPKGSNSFLCVRIHSVYLY